MRLRNLIVLILISIVFIVFIGCSKPYVITRNLDYSIEPQQSCSIGNIVDELPVDFDAEDKPTAENIMQLKIKLEEYLAKKDIYEIIRLDFPDADFEVTGAILDYKKGSGFLRFLFGAWAGAARVTVALDLTDNYTGDIIFSGNFYGTVTQWTESGDMIFNQVALNFAKALKKELKKLAKRSEG
jgi:hypothetical protein